MNCFLRINSLKQSPQLCAGGMLNVPSISLVLSFLLSFSPFYWPSVFYSSIGFNGEQDERRSYEYLDAKTYGLGAWIGSREGLFYMHWQVWGVQECSQECFYKCAKLGLSFCTNAWVQQFECSPYRNAFLSWNTWQCWCAEIWTRYKLWFWPFSTETLKLLALRKTTAKFSRW